MCNQKERVRGQREKGRERESEREREREGERKIIYILVLWNQRMVMATIVLYVLTNNYFNKSFKQSSNRHSLLKYMFYTNYMIQIP